MAVSKFEEEENNLQVQKLNSEIRALEDLLRKKTSCGGSFKKR